MAFMFHGFILCNEILYSVDLGNIILGWELCSRLFEI